MNSDSNPRTVPRVPTLKDVAERANVHLVTASVVLSKAQNAKTRVSEATRKRIIAAADELHYSPSALSRSFQKKNSNTVGYFMESDQFQLDSPYVQKLLTGLKDACCDRHYDLLLHTYSSREPFDSVRVRQAFMGSKTRGLVVHAPTDTELMRYLSNSHLPVVALTGSVDYVPTVIVDDAAGGVMTAEFVASRGLKNVLFLDTSHQVADAARRLQALKSTSLELGLTFDTFTHPVEQVDIDRLEVLIQRLRNTRTVIVGWNDDSLNVVLRLVRKLEMTIPAELSIVGFDGFKPLPLYSGVLTTVKADWHGVANCAIDQLDSIIAGREAPKLTAVPVTFQIGDSTI